MRRSYFPCRRGADSLVAEARIELACAAYGTALEPLQALRNKLAGEVGLEPTASALTVRHSATELLANSWPGWLDWNQRRPAFKPGRYPLPRLPKFWSGRVGSNHRPPAPEAGAPPLRYALTFQTGSKEDPNVH